MEVQFNRESPRIAQWFLNSGLANDELNKVSECGDELLEAIKRNKLTQIQAEAALNFVSVCLREQLV